MSIRRFGNRTIIEGDTIIRLTHWSGTISVLMAIDGEGSEFVKILEVDAYGNVKVSGRMQQQSDIQ